MKRMEWSTISRDLNAWHYDQHPDYWQWLYFDFVFDNGYSAAAVIMPRSIGSIPGVSLEGLTPEVWLTVLTPEGKRYDAKKAYSHSECRGERKGLDVQLGHNDACFTEERYQLNVSVDEIGMELELSPLLPPWTPLDDQGHANPAFLQTIDPSGAAYFNYIEFAPRGEAKGTLTLGDEKVRVAGLGYHEQGRGNFPLFKLFSHWYWFKFWLDEFTFIMPSGLCVPELFGQKMVTALLARGEEKLVDFIEIGPDLEIVKESDFRVEPMTQSRYPGRQEFGFEQNDVRIAGVLTSGPMVEVFPYAYPNYPDKAPGVYLRFLAELELYLDIRGEKLTKKGPGMQEMMITGG